MYIEKQSCKIFSVDPIEVLMFRYADLFGYISMLFICIAVIFNIDTDDVKYPKRIFYFFPLIFFFIYLPKLILKNFSHKISFDLNKSEAQFLMFFPSRKERMIVTKIKDIQKITVNYYIITFLIDGEKLRYNGVNNKELFDFLETLKPVSWMYFGKKFNKYYKR